MKFDITKKIGEIGYICWDDDGSYSIWNYYDDVIAEHHTSSEPKLWENGMDLLMEELKSGQKFPPWLRDVLVDQNLLKYISIYYRCNPDTIIILSDRIEPLPLLNGLGRIRVDEKHLRSLLDVQKIINNLPEYSTLYPVESDILIKYI